MRQAPPVSVLCRGRGWRHLQAAVFALTGAVVVGWWVWHAGDARVPAAVWSVPLSFVGTYLAAIRWLPASLVDLRWDGQQWWLDAQPCTAELMMQNRRVALLRLRTAAGSTWLAIEQTEAAAAWHGLLVALRHPRVPSTHSAEGQVG